MNTASEDLQRLQRKKQDGIGHRTYHCKVSHRASETPEAVRELLTCLRDRIRTRSSCQSGRSDVRSRSG